jgi:BNR repeat-like domain
VGAAAPAGCTHIFIDRAGADRPWITTAGTRAWLAYHDSKNSALIRVKRSTDDGKTWSAAGSPIPGQGAATGDATFNNSIGPIVADPGTGVVYESYAAGEPQTKATSANYNNIYVSRSADGGLHWTSTRVFHTSPFTRLNNFWPTLAVDPVTHAVYTAWTDQHGIAVSQSTDGGITWSPPVTVSDIRTTVMPWVAARNGKVDVVYYGSTAASVDDPAAVWNVYDSQFSHGAWAIKQVSNTPNRVGAVCMEGSGCVNNINRELLDLFEVAEDPASGKAAIIYTDSTIDTWTANRVTQELPEIVLAFEK